MFKASECYGDLTFGKKAMKEKLSKTVYTKLVECMDNDQPLDQSIANDVAHAMKEWAIANNATHFTHWFQPQRGGTAEKHDAFLSYDGDGELIERFSGSQLIQSEPDASSFPSGGMRSTFEARGYTAWDPTSPAYLIKAKGTTTLVIPSVFLSWTGHVLDMKTPYLRSVRAINDTAIKLQRMLGNRVAKRIVINCGPEQEYFLVTKELYAARPDLAVCGRTLFGAAPAKGQQMDDHYFGSIQDRVLKFMEDFDLELYKRGIPAKTRHNEVAPNQFEIAPLYEEGNLAIDHNLQMMDIMRRCADEHGLVALVHEKPFAGVNGSGKHLNWSIGDNTGANYLSPSKSPMKNISFLMTLTAILAGMNKYGGLLRATVANAGNDHRLGANEAPPAIISIYIGEYLSSLLDEIEGIGKVTEKEVAAINLGVQNLPAVDKDTSDRNRTSPVAFTSNKFEFRAVGSSHNCAESATMFNLIVAYGYDVILRRLEKMDGDVKANALTVIKDLISETKRIRFEGNGYSEEWHEEAEKRGLPNTKNTPAALEQYLTDEANGLYAKFGVLSKEELESKVEIKLEEYCNVKEIELKTAINMANTLIVPAVTAHLTNVANAAGAMAAAGAVNEVLKADVEEISSIYSEIKTGIKSLNDALSACQAENDILKQSHLYAGKGADALESLRASVDKAEGLVDDDLWPLAKYQELLANIA